jgi:hypothetical protein
MSALCDYVSFTSQTYVQKICLYTFSPLTDDIKARFEDDIESLVRVFVVGLLIWSNKRFQLSKELLDRIKSREYRGKRLALLQLLNIFVLFSLSDERMRWLFQSDE